MNYFMIYAIASVGLVSLYALINYNKIKNKIAGNPLFLTIKMVVVGKVSKLAMFFIALFLVIISVVACPIIVPFFIIKKIRKLFKKKEVKPNGYANVPKFFTEEDNSVGPIDLNMD